MLQFGEAAVQTDSVGILNIRIRAIAETSRKTRGEKNKCAVLGEGCFSDTLHHLGEKFTNIYFCNYYVSACILLVFSQLL